MKGLIIFLLFVNQACTKDTGIVQLEAAYSASNAPGISKELKEEILYNIEIGGLYGIPPKYKELYAFYVQLNIEFGKLKEISFSSSTDPTVQEQIRDAFNQNRIDWKKYKLDVKEKLALRFPVVYMVHHASNTYVPLTLNDAESLLQQIIPADRGLSNSQAVTFSPTLQNFTAFN